MTDEISVEFGEDLRTYADKAIAFYGNAGGLKKNPLAIAKTLEFVWIDGKKSNQLLDLTDRIVEFIKK